jgi:hypothetical protein
MPQAGCDSGSVVASQCRDVVRSAIDLEDGSLSTKLYSRHDRVSSERTHVRCYFSVSAQSRCLILSGQVPGSREIVRAGHAQ